MDTLLTQTPFRLFWFARIFSSLAYQMTSVVIGWLVYEKTGSAYDLGLIGLCQFMPIVLLTFVVGHVADRFNRRLIVASCQIVEAITLGFLTLGAFEGWLSVQTLFIAVFILGGAKAFEHPTMTALLPSVVPNERLTQGLSLATSAFQTATIAGPAFGGLLYGLGVIVPLSLGCILFFCAALCLIFMKSDYVAVKREPLTLKSVFSGVVFIKANPIILGTISLDLFAVLLGGVTSLLPIFAKDVLQTGAWGLGILRSAPAVGALAMSLLLARIQLRNSVGVKMFASVVVFGLATIIFSASTNIILSVIALVVLGASDSVSVVIRQSLVQLSTPDAMRGRVSSVNSLFIGTSNQLGEFESGMVAGLIGAVPAGIVGGIGTFVVVGLWLKLFPQLRHLDNLPEPVRS